MSTVVYSPLPHQRKFHLCDKPFVFMAGGLGSGKSYSLVMKMLRLAHQNYGLDGGFLAPDLKMFKRDILPLISHIIKGTSLRIKYNRTDGFIDLPETESRVWVFHDEDNGESIRGPNLAYFLINEATLISKGGIESAIGRVRLKDATVPQIAFSGTPEGFGYIYQEYIMKERDDIDVIYGSSKENPHLHGSFVKRLESSYDATLQQAYIGGQFVNLNGKQAAYAFNRTLHVEQCPYALGKYQIWISMDFNVNPMSATIWHRVTDNDKVKLWGIKSIKLRSSDTHEMARVIKDEYGTSVVIFPDPAGNARSTRGINRSDIQILEDAGFKDIRYKRRIASVRDCLNAMNNMFSKNEIKLDPLCVDTIADLEQVQLTDSGGLDKSDSMRTHWMDGLKDMIDYEFPVIKPLGSSTLQL